MVTKTFFAIVVDPYKTIANRRVEIGCFRCFNKEQTGVIPDDFDVPKDFKQVIKITNPINIKILKQFYHYDYITVSFIHSFIYLFI